MRFVVVALFAATILIFSQLVFSALDFFLVSSAYSSANSELEFTQNTATSKKMGPLEQEVEKINKYSDLISLFQKGNLYISDEIEKILKIKNRGVVINFISYSSEAAPKSGPRIQISGIADSRKDLISFVDGLRGVPGFEKVESPVSNLLADKDLEFDITITLSVKKSG
jgi:hypothetical protein